MKQAPLILHIAPTPFFADRGCHIRIEGVANSLKGLGFDNLVCTYHHGRDIDGIESSRIATIKGYTKTEAGPSKYKLWADWKLLWLLVKEIRRRKPEVIHAHLHEGLMIGLIAKILLFWKHIPMIADMQGSLVGELEAHGTFKKMPFLKWPIKLIEICLMKFAKTIVCSSQHSLDKFKAEFNLSPEKISLVQDGANRAKVPSDKDLKALKQEHRLPEDKVIVVYSGALLDGKGLNELKQVMWLSRELEHVHFLIIGYPTQNLAVFVSDHKLAEKTTMTGQIPFEELPKLLCLADIAIDPKFNDAGEGSGKMLNYLACGLPVLAFKTKNNLSFLPAGTELASNVEEMASILQTWSKSKSERQMLSAANLEHFKAHLSWGKTQEQLHTVYDRVLRK